jgi:hypothetical protein
MLHYKKEKSRIIEILVISITVWNVGSSKKCKSRIDMRDSMSSANYAESRQRYDENLDFCIQ